MKQATLLALAAVALLSAGCGSKPSSNDPPSTVANKGSEDQGSGTTGGTTDSPGAGTTATTGGQPHSGNSGTNSEPPINPKDLIPDIQKPDKVDTTSQQWGKTSLTPQQLAANIKKSFSSLRGAYAKASILFQNKKGNGETQASIYIQDSKTYRIDLPELAGDPTVGNVTANGLQKQSLYKGQTSPPVPLDRKTWMSSIPADKMDERWTIDFPKMMFRGIYDNNDAWESFVQTFGDAKRGYVLKAEQRDIPWNGKMVRNYRFLVTRTKQAAKKDGFFEMEVVLDGQKYVPVTVRVDARDLGNEVVFRANWSAGWNFDQKFPPKQFNLRPVN